MINKTKLSIWFLLLLFQVSVVSAYAEPTSQLNLLKDVHVEKGAETLTFRLEFNKPLKKNPQPVFYKKSVQLDFPGAFIIPSKRSFATQDALISQIFAVQQDPQTLRVRFVLGNVKHEMKDIFHLEKKGNGLVIRVDKNPKDVLDKLIANVKQAKAVDGKAKQTSVKAILPLPKPVSPPPPAVEEEPVIAEAIVDKIQTEETATESAKDVPVTVQKTAVNETAPVKSAVEKTPDFLKFKEPVAPEPPSLMASGWKMFYTLALVLAVMFFIFYVFKKVVLKNSPLGGNERLIKVLATGYLAPKKTVTVVDIAGEVLVLGISDGDISLLTQIHDDERIEKLRNASGNALGKILGRVGESKSAEIKPEATRTAEMKSEEIRPAVSQENNKLFSKYIKQFASEAESVQISSAASVAELIRKNRERIRAAS